MKSLNEQIISTLKLVFESNQSEGYSEEAFENALNSAIDGMKRYRKDGLIEVEIVVVNEAEDDKQDLIQDFVSVITSFCARIYEQRRSKRKTEKIIQELNNFSCENNK